MKKLLVSLLLVMGFAHAQTQTPVVTTPQFYDDSYVHVPLQFGFPFYGRTFTNSWMHSNGVVSFLDPAVPVEGVGYNPAQWAYCCQGIQPTTTTPQFSYMIAPMWTDLYPTGQSSFRTEGTSTYQRYFWNNLPEISNFNNLNSFSLEIKPDGFIGVDYTLIGARNQQTWIGTIGDPTQSQWNQIYYGVGVPSSLQNWSTANTGVVDQCTINPLSSPTCSGYTEAMCSANPLFSTSCPGYASAYYTQQCSLNSLFDPSCPGYANAYLTYQCSINPLYSTTCEGYETAYFNQQCTLDPLYNNQCPGYDRAYALANVVPTTTVTTTPTTTTQESTQVAVVSDPVVNNVISTTTTSTSPATAATAVVALTPQPSTTTTTTTVVADTSTTTENKNESTTDASSTSSSSSTTNNNSSSSTEKKDQQKTARQELQERRVAAARAKAVEDGKNLASTVSNASSIEQQVAVQNVVIAAMGYTPGFDAYGKAFIPDVKGYKPFEIYKGQKNVDNRLLSRGLTGPSDKLHESMIELQYNKN